MGGSRSAAAAWAAAVVFAAGCGRAPGAPPATEAQAVAAGDGLAVRLAAYWSTARLEWNDDLPAERDPQLAVTSLAGDAAAPQGGRGQPIGAFLAADDRLWLGTAGGPRRSGERVEAGRAPHFYRYDLDDGRWVVLDPPPGGAGDALRRGTLAIRSAGSDDGVVFLAGPAVGGGVNLFAWTEREGTWLGAHHLGQWDEIRAWTRAGESLYAAAGRHPLPGLDQCAGAILRWRGRRSTSPTTLFDFEVVGGLATEAAYLAEHEGHLYATTRPLAAVGEQSDAAAAERGAALFRSPGLSAGLAAADARRWTRIWSVDDYEPDAIAARATAGGPLASHRGRLVWSTTSVDDPDLPPVCDDDERTATALGARRAATLWSAQFGDDGAARVTLLYGERYLPRLAAGVGYGVAANAAHENRARQAPRLGSSGFGEPWAAGATALVPFADELYVLVAGGALLRIGDAAEPAVIETSAGFDALAASDGALFAARAGLRLFELAPP